VNFLRLEFTSASDCAERFTQSELANSRKPRSQCGDAIVFDLRFFYITVL
jgi:hypothetical protein